MNAGETADTGRTRPARRRVLVAGASGYIGRHVFRELVARGYEVVGLVRHRPPHRQSDSRNQSPASHPGTPQIRQCELTDPQSLLTEGIRGESFDAVISCIASRTGGIRDTRLVDDRANQNLLQAAKAAGVGHFVLLSALCVQRPVLAFQHAKLAFEASLRGDGIDWTVVRPTAFFKSLAGQVPRVKAGKPFLIFGPGDGPACKPISEGDLASYIADCLEQPGLLNRILPIGGPGPAVTPRERGDMLFELCGQRPRFRHLPLSIFGAAEKLLGAAARVVPRLEDKAEFARIGRFYATEPMLAIEPRTGEHSDAATPEYGHETLHDFYRRVVIEGLAGQELGDQALF